MDDILVPDTYYQYYYNEAVYTEFDGDGQLTSAIDSVVSNASHKAYAVTNHGESDLGTEISALLTKNHFKVSDLGLLLEGAVPDDCEVLILNQPTRDLAKDELKFIQTYLSKGGQVSLVLPGEDFDHPNLDALMKEYGLQLAGGYAGDTQRYYTSAQSYLTFFPELNTDRRRRLRPDRGGPGPGEPGPGYEAGGPGPGYRCRGRLPDHLRQRAEGGQRGRLH